MQFDTQWLSFCGMLLLTALGFLLARKICLSAMKSIEKSGDLQPLQPAELAFLIRPSDSSHCLIVLVVDLVQKALKKSLSDVEQESLKFRYEQLVVSTVVAYIKDWSTQKAHAIVPELTTGNPLKIASGFWRVRHWISNNIKSIFTDLIKDPLSIRKFFSPTGIMKVFVSLIAAGVKDQVAGEIHTTVLKRNLLVPADKRQAFSKNFALLACLHVIAIFVLLVAFSGVHSWAALIAIAFFTGLNGMLLRALKALPGLVPYYDELALVLDSAQRQGVRLRFLRGLLRCLRIIYWSIAVIAYVVVIVLQSLVFGFLFGLHAGMWWENILGLIALTINFVLVADLLLLAKNVALNDQLTSEGERQIRQHLQQIRNTSLIESFSRTLSEPGYHEDLSTIVALYGIETLFFVA